jgi:hypothetical protein
MRGILKLEPQRETNHEHAIGECTKAVLRLEMWVSALYSGCSEKKESFVLANLGEARSREWTRSGSIRLVRHFTLNHSMKM